MNRPYPNRDRALRQLQRHDDEHCPQQPTPATPTSLRFPRISVDSCPILGMIRTLGAMRRQN